MEPKNILNITTREEFRKWLNENHKWEKECWMVAQKGKNPPTDCVWYLDAVEEVLCFGWIDTTHKNMDGVDMQRFTPRTAKSPWSELNEERCRRLEKLGLMTDAGRAVLPDMSESSFVIDPEIQKALCWHWARCWSNKCAKYVDSLETWKDCMRFYQSIILL